MTRLFGLPRGHRAARTSSGPDGLHLRGCRIRRPLRPTGSNRISFSSDGGVDVRIVVPRETAPGERRVALVPESCKKLIQAGYDISIESGAGDAAGFSDDAYRDPGVTLVDDARTLLSSAALVLKIGAPSVDGARDETAWMRPGTIYVGSLMPLRNLDAVRALAAGNITAFATDAIPRTTRAQSMDTLSSMANL